MPLPNNEQAIENFKQHKTKFDEQLQHLQLLSQHNFGIEEDSLRHCHCGEILYYIYLLEEVTHSIMNRNALPPKETK